MVTRDELFDAVWSAPMTTLAARYEVSANYLARVCDSLNVPRPLRGHWAKKEYGKAVPRPELPPAPPGTPTSWSPGDGDMIRRSTPRPTAQAPAGKALKSSSVQTHVLIQGAMAHFLKSRVKEKYGYLKPYKYHLVDLTVSTGGLEQALAFANLLFLALEKRGHRIALQSCAYGYHLRPSVDPLETGGKRSGRSPHYNLWSPGRITVAYVDGQEVGLQIVEVAKSTVMRYVRGTYIPEAEYLATVSRSRHRQDGSWTTTNEIPSGRLRLVAYSPHFRVELSEQWEESKAASLVKRVPELVSAIEGMAKKLPDLVREAERQLEIERRERDAENRRYAIRNNKRRIEESEAASRQQLDEIISLWARDRSRSDFLDTMEADVRLHGGLEREPLFARLELARRLIGSLDPLVRFQAWVAPGERYEPLEFGEEE